MLRRDENANSEHRSSREAGAHVHRCTLGFTDAKRGAHAFGGPAAVTFTKRENSDIENGKIKKGAPPEQLYDLEADLAQTKNVFLEHPEVVKELKDLLATYNEKLVVTKPNRRKKKKPLKR